ncbi:potassium channel family protein [Methanobrevibacter sp.]|uniref:potassium channel family protein n=1 Tax=Methanobrevibacter sp. TaxID=66852 RepID=UPI0025D7AF43|nr:potassium channel family protein [Methanobrevibacter sp.]MBQ2962600.1 ion transporter [Methanobrevibacter sp.]
MKDYFKKLDIILTILVILDILLILGSLLFNLSSEYINFILLFDTVLCIILIINFIMKLKKSRDRKAFFNKYWLDLFASFPIALLVLPFMLSTLYAYPAIVLVRLLRLILLFRIFSKFVERILDATYLDRIIAVFIVIILGSIIALYCFDPNIKTIFDAVWFVFQTITTVGYGDMIPTSPIGRFIGLIVLIAGVMMFSVFTACFAYIFNDKVFKKENEEFNQKMNTLKDNLNETKSSIDEIKRKTILNEDELAEMKETINNLSERIDYLIDIVEKKE